MNLGAITKALSVPCALIRYNRRHRTTIREPELIILYILGQYDSLNKKSVIIKLSKLNHTCDYSQLNKRIKNLTDHRFVDKRQGAKNKFSITPEGRDFLFRIEEWSRTYRIDKIKF